MKNPPIRYKVFGRTFKTDTGVIDAIHRDTERSNLGCDTFETGFIDKDDSTKGIRTKAGHLFIDYDCLVVPMPGAIFYCYTAARGGENK